MRILLVEDSASLCETLVFHLEHEGYEVDACGDGADALEYIKNNAYDLVLLDRMLPGLDGLSVLAAMRRDGIQAPVLMITALDGIGERVAGLDAGADDYLVKPFAVEEMLARVRSLCRRPREWKEAGLLRYGDVSLDTLKQHLQGESGAQTITRRETQLLEIFLRHPDKVLPREMLFSLVWGADAEVENGNLDNYIHFLRARLRDVGSRLQIKTQRSVGYQLKS